MSLEELSERADRISGSWRNAKRGYYARRAVATTIKSFFPSPPETILIRTIAARSRARPQRVAKYLCDRRIRVSDPLKNRDTIRPDSDFDKLTSVSVGPGHGLQFMRKRRSITGERKGRGGDCYRPPR